MIQGMDALAETELVESIAELGNWHNVDDKKWQYLASKEKCMAGLKDILIALSQDNPQQGYLAHLKLGEKKVLNEHLVPLFAAYREDPDISVTVLKLMMQLTMHVDVQASDKLRLLHYLQDYKEAFVKKDVFIILMGMLVESMEDEEDTQQRGDGEKKDVFDEVLTLLRNLMSVPDPCPGDAGFTPMRKTLQLSYIRHFHDEGVLDFFLLFAEQMESSRKTEQVWALLEILYHIVTKLDPEGIMQVRSEKERRVLASLLERDQDHTRITRTHSSRHSRFGFTIQKRDAIGGVSTSATMNQTSAATKGSRMAARDFKNKTGGEKKINMFQDPFFVDMEEGSVKDHNQINPHVKQALDTSNDLSEAVLSGLRKFFEEFVQTSFSTLVSFARGNVLGARDSSRPYGRQHLLNFMSWVLEFHRHHYFGEVTKAKQNQTPAPTIDIASIQGAIDLDMIQFCTARLREYGKESQIHSSFLVLVLRALCQQVKTVGIVMESKDSETRDCGEILTQNIVKEDVMTQLCWIMKNFKSSAHDPRVLSYTVEVFHHMVRLMRKITDRQNGAKVEFHVERVFGQHMRRAATTVSGEIESLADAAVVENLFHLLEKYKRHSASLNSMLVKLIYTIIRADPCNIVVFFELSYFVRIQRIWSDPLIRDRKQGKKYLEMIELLRYIMRQFFKCAEKNKCVFVELLFRKTFAKKQDAVMENHQSEFHAILGNYEDEAYAEFLERMRHGESFEAMKTRQRQLLDGSLPWTEEEDNVLRDRYHVFMDHPLCMELLAAELPEDSRRNAKGVKKRLVELGLQQTKGNRDAEEAGLDPAETPSKKAKMSEEAAEEEMDVDNAMFQDGADIDSLEMDLEKLLDAEESRRFADVGTSASSGANVATSAVDADADTQPEEGLNLEMELEAMIDESGSQMPLSQSQGMPAPSLPGAAPAPEADSLEADLEALIGNDSLTQGSQATQVDPPSAQAAATLEDDLADILEESGVKTQPSPAKGSAVGTQPSQAGDDDEQFWADAVTGASPEAPGSRPADAESPGPSISQQPGGEQELSQEPSSLQMALEKMFDDE